jgi:GTP diphosphokinase / guanosine-3',5'-bis(diphosphate) 3'-diphosphatase
MIYTNKIEQAINLAIASHSGQNRKGDVPSPYIVHPLSVVIVLAMAGADEDTICAGVLHDVAEDTNTTLAEIEEKFGKRVASTVSDVTEHDKSLPWEERKRQALEHIKHMPKESLLVKSADTLCNLRDTVSNYLMKGDDAYKIFKAPKEKVILNFSMMIVELDKAWPENPLLPELKEAMLKLDAR